MSIRMRTASLAFAALLALSAIGFAGAKQDKVYICHHTGSESNPVVIIHVGKPAEKGHLAAPGNGPHNKNSHLDPGEDVSSPDPIEDIADCGDDGGPQG